MMKPEIGMKVIVPPGIFLGAHGLATIKDIEDADLVMEFSDGSGVCQLSEFKRMTVPKDLITVKCAKGLEKTIRKGDVVKNKTQITMVSYAKTGYLDNLEDKEYLFFPECKKCPKGKSKLIFDEKKWEIVKPVKDCTFKIIKSN